MNIQNLNDKDKQLLIDNISTVRISDSSKIKAVDLLTKAIKDLDKQLEET